MVRKIGDLLAVGLILIGIFIFFSSIGAINIVSQIAGILGSLIVILVELTILKDWFKK